MPKKVILTGLFVALSASVALARDGTAPGHAVPPSPDGDLVVGLCDGQTSVAVSGVKTGQAMTPQRARAVSGELMDLWKRKNPKSRWDDEERIAQAEPGSPSQNGQAGTGETVAPSAAARGGVHAQAQAYGAFSNRDEAIWQASTDAFIDQGNRTFHDANALGGTIAVSCDMCHPNAANTHPETYPKYQVQLGRVALLRDMINWCIENPVRGKPLADDDPKLRSLEAYILAQRKGVPLAYGRH
jgi:thiosulfate dehydrogenase